MNIGRTCISIENSDGMQFALERLRVHAVPDTNMEHFETFLDPLPDTNVNGNEKQVETLGSGDNGNDQTRGAEVRVEDGEESGLREPRFSSNEEERDAGDEHQVEVGATDEFISGDNRSQLVFDATVPVAQTTVDGDPVELDTPHLISSFTTDDTFDKQSGKVKGQMAGEDQSDNNTDDAVNALMAMGQKF